MNIEPRRKQSQYNASNKEFERSPKQAGVDTLLSTSKQKRQMVWVTAATEMRASEPYLVYPQSSIRHLKSLIQLSFDIPVSEQVLKLGQRVIDDSKTFSEEGLLDQARLMLAAKEMSQ